MSTDVLSNADPSSCGERHPDRDTIACRRENGHSGPHAALFTRDNATGELTPRIVW